MEACLAVGGGLTSSAEDDVLLVNLDGASVFASEWLCSSVERGRLTVAHYHNPHSQGTYGRLVCTKSLLIWVEGYDMEFLPMGCQGTGLKMRLAKGGQSKRREVGLSVPNAPTTGKKRRTWMRVSRGLRQFTWCAHA